MIEFAFPDDPIRVIKEARALADVLERILANGGASATDLDGAPVLDLYCPALGQSHRLIGTVAGHPHLRDQRTIVTSELFVIDRAAGWARTWSRFYALGRPADLANARSQ